MSKKGFPWRTGKPSESEASGGTAKRPVAATSEDGGG